MSMMVQSGRFGGSFPVEQPDWFNTSSGTSFSSTRAIGAASPNRWIIVGLAINYNAGRKLNSVTVGGISATLMYASPDPLGVAGSRTEYWKVNVPTGITASVAATADGSMFDGSVFVWTVYKEPILHDSEEDPTVSSGSYSLTIDVLEGGAVLVICNNNGGTTTINSITGFTQDGVSAPRDIISGHADLLPAETGRTIAITLSSGSPNPAYDGLSAISITF